MGVSINYQSLSSRISALKTNLPLGRFVKYLYMFNTYETLGAKPVGNFLPAPGSSNLVVNAKYCYRKSPRTNARSGTTIGG